MLGATRYYIRTNANCFQHNNHSPSYDILCRRRNIPPNVLSLLSQMLLRHCPVSVGRTLLQEMTGRDVSVDSIRRLKHQLLSDQFSDDNTTNRQSTGQQLLNLLKSSKEIDHIYLCASRDLGSTLVTLRRQNKRLGGKTDTLPSGERRRDLQELLTGLQLDSGQEVLVAVAWMSFSQRR